MGLSIYNIKKWVKMFAGKSVLHVEQGMGQAFEVNEIKGYFNDLTQKVLMQPQYVECNELPTVKTEQGEDILFPVAVFQYALGCWDLYLLKKDEIYKKKFLDCANWTVETQEPSGAWNNFGFVYPKAPYGAMCQGEAASLLLRTYKVTNDKRYLYAAQKAIDYMLIPIESGGTAQYTDDGILLYEFTNKAIVLNGWIFSLFGLYELTLVVDDEKYHTALSKTVKALKSRLSEFDNGYWSMYDLAGHITSPFYHELHIAQMEALYKTLKLEEFKLYEKKFSVYSANKWNKIRALLVKIFQKIRE